MRSILLRILLVFMLLVVSRALTGNALARPATQGAGELSYGDTVDDEVTDSSGDRWTFSGEAGDVVQIEMVGRDGFDSYLELHAPNDNELTSDDDGGEGYDALIQSYALPTSGTYTIVARGFGGETGDYTLSLERTGTDTDSNQENSLSYGDTVSDMVTGSAGDRWMFSGSAGDVVRIQMFGRDGLDSYLELLAPSGVQLTSDDDGGEGYDAQIDDYDLPSSGTYTIIARGFGGDTGPYSLSLERTGASGVPDLSGVPGILQIEHSACSASDTYFVLSFDGSRFPNYAHFEFNIEAEGVSTVINYVFPIVGSQLGSRINGEIRETITVTIGESSFSLSGIESGAELMQAFEEEWEQQSRTNVTNFGIVWANTARQPALNFVVFGSHPGPGSLTVTIRWAQNSRETMSEEQLLVSC